ncbi:GNAT family N-acetyltransferase [Lampropedia aestuarii]|uniref:GNAT family N-acetyltransferase n=1 Tax=Lampropedia aestuarii TaxID=2562762 RepID=UPI0024683035|nr:GNAT family N-acetyltransferase [Lampropedia aestuarii]MDH5858054.1 GNAT family N-acetyltransferase [Lampropedia aestuarii]
MSAGNSWVLERQRPQALQIRLAIPADVARIFAIRTAVCENHLSMQQLAKLGITEQAVLELIHTQDCTWVAEAAGCVLGFAIADHAEACVFALFVKPQHEGQGAGSALLHQAEQSLFQTQAHIWLETSIDSRAAQLYQRRGWQIETLLPISTEGRSAGPQDAVFVKHRPAA